MAKNQERAVLLLASNITFVRKIIFTLASCLLLAFAASAQAPAGQAPKGAQAGPPKGAQAGPPTLGRAFGKVTDSTGKPLEQASVLLLKPGVDPTTKKPKLVLYKGMDVQRPTVSS